MSKWKIVTAAIAAMISVQILSAQPDPAHFKSDSLLIVVPFTDASGFKGNWDLAVDIPRFLTVYIKERFRTGVISPLSALDAARERKINPARLTTMENLKSIAEHFKTQYVVAAEIKEFSISRFMVSEVQLAGYESFSSEVRIRFILYDASRFGGSRNAVVYEGDAEGTVTDRGLGITLFGKQTNRANQYFALDEIAFGSDAFNRTIIGEALLKCADDFGTKLERAIPSLVSRSVVLSSSVIIDSTGGEPGITIKRRLVNGEIVLVDGDEVFINLGSQDGIAVGDRLPVLGGTTTVTDPATGSVLGTRDDTIGEIQVIEIRAEHLALAAIISGKGMIEPKQRVRKVFVR